MCTNEIFDDCYFTYPTFAENVTMDQRTDIDVKIESKNNSRLRRRQKARADPPLLAVPGKTSEPRLSRVGMVP